jgi:hypothetical protein
MLGYKDLFREIRQRSQEDIKKYHFDKLLQIECVYQNPLDLYPVQAMEMLTLILK